MGFIKELNLASNPKIPMIGCAGISGFKRSNKRKVACGKVHKTNAATCDIAIYRKLPDDLGD